MLESLKKEHDEKMNKVVEDLHHAFDTLRTGRASVSLVDHLPVEAYGSTMPLIQMATISTPDAKTILITPFDPSQVKAIEKAIQVSNVGLTPQNDGKNIRLNVPTLTEDRRKELVKLAKKYAEDHRVSVRQERHRFLDELKKMQKNSDISEDDYHRLADEVQKLTDENIKKIDEELDKKEKEIMEV